MSISRVPIFSNSISSLVLLLVALPFGNVLYLSLGFVTLSLAEILYIGIIYLALLMMLKEGMRPRFSLLFGMCYAIAICYVLISVAIWSVSFKQAMIHLRFYLPFFAAIMILSIPIKGDLEKFTVRLVMASIVSSTCALAIYFLFPQIILRAFANYEEASIIILEQGRLHWGSSLIIVFLLCLLLNQTRHVLITALAFLLACAASLLALNRTELLGLLFMFVISQLFNRSVSTRRKFVTAVISALAVGMITALLLSSNEKFAELVDSRIFGNGDVNAVYENAVLENRYVLYVQYFRSLNDYFLFGQGLGRPFAVVNYQRGYMTDISLLSFALPFGIFGVILFFYFLYATRKAIKDSLAVSRFEKSAKKFLPLLLLTLALISLNVDVFSRDNAVVWFAMLVSLLSRSRRYMVVCNHHEVQGLTKQSTAHSGLPKPAT